MLAPDGSLMGMPLSVMHDSPFTNFFIPGLTFVYSSAFTRLGIAFWNRLSTTWNCQTRSSPSGNTIGVGRDRWAAGMIVLIWLTVELLWVRFSILHEIYYIWAGLILLFTLLPKTRKSLKIK